MTNEGVSLRADADAGHGGKEGQRVRELRNHHQHELVVVAEELRDDQGPSSWSVTRRYGAHEHRPGRHPGARRAQPEGMYRFTAATVCRARTSAGSERSTPSAPAGQDRRAYVRAAVRTGATLLARTSGPATTWKRSSIPRAKSATDRLSGSSGFEYMNGVPLLRALIARR